MKNDDGSADSNWLSETRVVKSDRHSERREEEEEFDLDWREKEKERCFSLFVLDNRSSAFISLLEKRRRINERWLKFYKLKEMLRRRTRRKKRRGGKTRGSNGRFRRRRFPTFDLRRHRGVRHVDLTGARLILDVIDHPRMFRQRFERRRIVRDVL